MPVSATVSRAALAGARPVFRPSAVSLQARRAFHGAGGFRPGGAGGRGWQYYASGGQRRWQSTAEGAARAGWFQRMWDSPIGLKTVHFWAPVMKWALVLAGISDFARPAEKLSVTQNAALTATGLIWTRWCLIIKPKNYLYVALPPSPLPTCFSGPPMEKPQTGR